MCGIYMIPLQNNTHTKLIAKEKILGYTVDWNYDRDYVDISMPEYIPNVLKRILYKAKASPQYSPREHAAVNWTNKGERHYAQKPDDTPFL